MSSQGLAVQRQRMSWQLLRLPRIALNLNRFPALLFSLLLAPQAFGQLAPSGEHYAGRASDTGYAGALVNATGTYGASIPIEIPQARGGLPIPLQLMYRAHGVGAAGLGWDVPLSYVQNDRAFAHRRPLSAPGALPVPRERTYLSFLGQNLELQQEGTSTLWYAHSGTLALQVRHTGPTWVAQDGTGNKFTFERPAAFGATGLWLLTSVSGAGGARVELSYQTKNEPLDGGAGLEVNLVGIRYNPHPLVPQCWKNQIVLIYGMTSQKPVVITVLGDTLFTRRDLLTGIDVQSRATCESPLERLRRYQLTLAADPDPDTGLPRLGPSRSSVGREAPRRTLRCRSRAISTAAPRTTES
jgi:hypothetical protein